MRISVLAAALCAALLLAGCAGTVAPSASEGPDGTTLAPKSGLACVRGVVVDEAIRPVAKPFVRIEPAARNATGDGEGRFAFCDLEPGTYFVSANAVGFGAAQISVDLRPDEVKSVRVPLPLDLSPRPYHVTLKHEAFMQAWAGIAQFVLENEAPSGLCDCTLIALPDPGVKTFVLETSWANNDPSGSDWYWILGESDGEGMYESGYAFTPIVKHVAAEAANYDPGSEVFYRQDGPDFAVISETRFTQFLTVFYNEAAPTGWSFLGGDT